MTPKWRIRVVLKDPQEVRPAGVRTAEKTVTDWRRLIMAKDPVCGMNVDEKKATAAASHGGKTYYFCSAGCKATFEKAPDKYAVK